MGQVKMAMSLWDTKNVNDRTCQIAAFKRQHSMDVSINNWTHMKK